MYIRVPHKCEEFTFPYRSTSICSVHRDNTKTPDDFRNYFSSCYGSFIAKTSSTKIGYATFKLALPAFLIAFCMALQPELCVIGSVGNILLVIVFCLLSVFAMAVGLEGYLKVALPIWRRVLWSIAGILLILPGLTTSIPGLVLIVLLVVTGKNLLHRKKEKSCA
ncbi:hypothetical protein ACVS9P_08430 [Caproicibacterium sp. NSD3]